VNGFFLDAIEAIVEKAANRQLTSAEINDLFDNVLRIVHGESNIERSGQVNVASNNEKS
jgi:hypothetical protein